MRLIKNSKTREGFRKKVLIGVLGASAAGLVPAAAFAMTSTAQTAQPTVSAPATEVTATLASAVGPASDNGSLPSCTPANFAVAKRFVQGQLQDRVNRLDQLGHANWQARAVTPSDRAVLRVDISRDLAGMRSLQSQVSDDATCGSLTANASTMVYGYRVYLVMTPQTDLVISADSESAIASRTVASEPGIEAAIRYAAAHGKNVVIAEQAFDNLKIEAADALVALHGVSANVLSQTASGYPQNQIVFVDAHNNCTTADANLRQVRDDESKIFSIL